MVERMDGKLMEEVEWKPLYGGAQGKGKFKWRSKTETIVWWSTVGEKSRNREAERRPLYGGRQNYIKK